MPSRARPARFNRGAGAVLIAAASLAAPALAADYHWAVVNGTWNNGPNWSPSGEPHSADRAILDFDDSAQIDVIDNVPAVSELQILDGDVLSIQHNGFDDGFVSTTGNCLVGGFGALNIFPGKGGIVSSGQGHLSVGGELSDTSIAGVFQNGGTVTVGSISNINSKIDLSGHYRMMGGTLSAGYLDNSGGFEADAGETDLGGASLSNNTFQYGGVVNVGSLGADGGGMVLSSSAAFYDLEDGTLNAFAMSLESGSSLHYNGGTISCGTLSISGDSNVRLNSGGGKILFASALNLGTNSSGSFDGGIDLTDNTMIVNQAFSYFFIPTLIRNGTYDGVRQTFTGIISSTARINNGSAHPTALGFAPAAVTGIGTFNGIHLNPQGTVIRYTYAGDANLDGVVNALDFNALASAYGQAGQFWWQGDFDNDGVVNSQDFTLLAQNFGQALPTPALESLAPEPATLALMLFPAGVLLLLRRRRRSLCLN